MYECLRFDTYSWCTFGKWKERCLYYTINNGCCSYCFCLAGMGVGICDLVLEDIEDDFCGLNYSCAPHHTYTA